MSSNKKVLSRQRRSRKTRANIREKRQVRLSVHRSSQHIYAQIISADGASVIAAASTVDKDLKLSLKGSTSNIEAAKAVGTLLAERALGAGVKEVAFDRSGFRYHGRVKALADAAREGGIQF